MASSVLATKEAGSGRGSFLSPRFWLPIIIIAVAITLIWWWSNQQAIEVTGIEAGNEVLLILKTRSANETNRESELKGNLRILPQDIVSVAALVQLYIERSRSESDPRYLGYAQHLLKPWWQNPTPPPAIQRLRAILLQGQHRFKEALVDLDALLTRNSNDAQSLLTRATVHQVLGNYREALSDCLNLSRHAPIPAVACAGSILSLTGRATDAQALLARIEPRIAIEPVSTRQWILTLRGEIAARAGQSDKAEKFYIQALNEPLRSAYLLREYSQFLLRKGRNKEVLKLLRDETYDDSLLLHAAIAAQKTGDKDLLREYTELIETRLRNAKLRGSTDHYYLAGRYALELENLPEKAIQLANTNWLKSKESRDTELLAAVAVATGDQSTIGEIRRWMSTQNAVLPNVLAILNAYGD